MLPLSVTVRPLSVPLWLCRGRPPDPRAGSRVRTCRDQDSPLLIHRTTACTVSVQTAVWIHSIGWVQTYTRTAVSDRDAFQWASTSSFALIKRIDRRFRGSSPPPVAVCQQEDAAVGWEVGRAPVGSDRRQNGAMAARRGQNAWSECSSVLLANRPGYGGQFCRSARKKHSKTLSFRFSPCIAAWVHWHV